MNQISAYVYVRMSTDLQRKGDSLRRQTERAKAYAEANGLNLHTRAFSDLGISAFDGKNVKEGELGDFLKEMETGSVAKGSYLLVESLDRLSRSDVSTAFALLNKIIQGGVVVVTLIDSQKYDRKIEFSQLMMSLAIMMRAHDESLHKSKRHKANWDKKRRDITVKKMTSTCPHWLKLNEDKQTFSVDKKRAEIVREIFDDTINGFGTELIAKRLNERGVPPWGRTNGWRQSYLKKILSGGSVRGHIEVTDWNEGVQTKRIVEDYYPRIIEDDLYFRAQQASASRRNKGGRKGKQIANLFSGLIKCGYCNSPMHLKDRGAQAYQYLVCDRGRRGMDCTTAGYRYDGLEATFLKLITEVNLAALFDEKKQINLLSQIQQKIDTLKGQEHDLSTKIERLIDHIEAGNAPSQMVARMKLHEEDIERINNELKQCDEAYRAETSRIADTLKNQEMVGDAIAKMKSLRGDDRTVLRTKIQQRLRSLVDCIEIYSIGRERSNGELSYLANYESGLNRDGHLLPSGHDWIFDDATRNYVVGFKSGRTFIVIPTKDDPIAVEAYIDSANL